MTLPTWLQPALIGAGTGAVALAILGFSYFGWTTGGSATAMADKAATAAVATALTPYCVGLSGMPEAAAGMVEFKAASAYARKDVVTKAGWATPMGADKPNAELAQACQLKIAAAL